MFLVSLILHSYFICLKHFLELVNKCNFIFQFIQVVQPVHFLEEWDEFNQEMIKNDEVWYKLGPKKKKNTTLALGKKHYLHCFGLLTCFSVCVSLWLSGMCPLSLCCFPFYFCFSSHAFLLMSIQRLKLAHVLAWRILLNVFAVVATFSRFVFGHLFFYCHVGYWFFFLWKYKLCLPFLLFIGYSCSLPFLLSISYHFPFHFSFVASIAVVLTFIGVHLH